MSSFQIPWDSPASLISWGPLPAQRFTVRGAVRTWLKFSVQDQGLAEMITELSFSVEPGGEEKTVFDASDLARLSELLPVK